MPPAELRPTDVVIPLESRELRHALRVAATGSAAIAVEDGYGIARATPGDVFRAASSLPGRIIVRVADARDVYETIVRRRCFSVNVFAGEVPAARSGSIVDPGTLVPDPSGPRMAAAAAFLQCEVEWVEPFDRGAVFVGRVIEAAMGSAAATGQTGPAAIPEPAHRSSSSSLPVLRVATTPNDSGAQVYYARDRGFFAGAGIAVDIVQMSNGSMIARDVASGVFDVASSSLLSVASAHERGFELVVVAPGSLWNRRSVSSALIVAGGSPMRRARDLNGKTVAVNAFFNVMQLSVQAWMSAHGADASTVNFVEYPFFAMAQAVMSGDVDAAFVAQPFLDAATAIGARVLCAPYTAIAPSFMINGWYTTRSFARANADTLERFDLAMAEAARWANAHQDLSRVILQRETNTAGGPGMTRVAYAHALDPVLIQPVIDASARHKGLRSAFPASEILAAR